MVDDVFVRGEVVQVSLGDFSALAVVRLEEDWFVGFFLVRGRRLVLLSRRRRRRRARPVVVADLVVTTAIRGGGSR